MTPRDDRRVDEIVARARELLGPEREQFLEQACGADEALREEVARRLAGESVAPDFLRSPGPSSVEAALKALSLDCTGAQMGDFRLEQVIGRGATGIVHEATQVSLGRRVAVKILAPLIVSNAERLERFRREAYSQSRLRHPYIAAAFYFGTENGLPYLAMERVQGKSLREHMAEARARRAEPGGASGRLRFDPFDPRTAAELIAKVASALDYCHRQGVIHRDIKPNNILIDAEFEPRLIDFGIARDQSLETLTRTNDISGTPFYMSPEQARARKKRISHRTDVYSAGAVLYEMLTGLPPFPGTDSVSVLHSICNDALRPVRSINTAVPRALERICHKAMEKDPELRYGTAGELAEDLRSFLAGRMVRARSRSVVRRAKEWVSRRPAVTAACLVLAMSAAFGIFEWRRQPALAWDVPALRSVDGSSLQKAGIPAAVYERMSPEERLEAYKRYIALLMEALPDTPPSKAVPEQPK